MAKPYFREDHFSGGRPGKQALEAEKKLSGSEIAGQLQQGGAQEAQPDELSGSEIAGQLQLALTHDDHDAELSGSEIAGQLQLQLAVVVVGR